MFQFTPGESVRVVHPPEHCLYLNGYRGIIVQQVNKARYLVRLDPRTGIPSGRWQLYYLPLLALEKAN